MPKPLFIGIGIVVLAILSGGIFFYQSDLRLNEDWRLTKTGALTIDSIPGARVFIDNQRSGTIPESGSLDIKKILPGKRNVLVALDGRWPWTKSIAIKSEIVSKVEPFLLPSSPNARVLKNQDEDYGDATKALKTIVLPTPSKPLASPDKTIDVYVRDNILGAIWRGEPNSVPQFFCLEGECGPVNVLQSPSGIRGISFYGTRSDVLIVAVTNGIFALDIDPTGTQNFQPLYLGTEPIFTPKDEHTLYIQDGPFVIELSY